MHVSHVYFNNAELYLYRTFHTHNAAQSDSQIKKEIKIKHIRGIKRY